jgi:hypothetical protein
MFEGILYKIKLSLKSIINCWLHLDFLKQTNYYVLTKFNQSALQFFFFKKINSIYLNNIQFVSKNKKVNLKFYRFINKFNIKDYKGFFNITNCTFTSIFFKYAKNFLKKIDIVKDNKSLVNDLFYVVDLKDILINYFLNNLINNVLNKKLVLKNYKLRKLLIYPFFIFNVSKAVIQLKDSRSIVDLIKMYFSFYNSDYNFFAKKKINIILLKKFLHMSYTSKQLSH